MKYYLSVDLQKISELVIVNTDTNVLKSLKWYKEIPDKIFSLALSVKEKGDQIPALGIVFRWDRFSEKERDVNECLKYNLNITV